MRSQRPRRTPRSWSWWRQGMNTDVQQMEKVSQLNVVGVFHGESVLHVSTVYFYF
jgi:hypothetical protein